MATDHVTPRSRWDAAADVPRGPLHLTFRSLHGEASSAQAALHAALGTSVPSYWIGPSTFEVAFGHFAPLRRDPVHVDPDLIVVRETADAAMLDVKLRVSRDWPTVPTALALPLATPAPGAPIHGVPRGTQAAAEIKSISNLSDEALGEIFPVTREHFGRWRSGRERSPSEGNLRQLLALRHLMRDLRERVDSPREWLLSPIEGVPEALSPYELLRRARFEDVWHLLEAMPSRAETRYHLDEEGGWTSSPAAAVPFDHEPDDSPSIPLGWDDED